MSLTLKGDLLPGVVRVLQEAENCPAFELSLEQSAASIQAQFYQLAEDFPKTIYPMTSTDWSVTFTFDKVTENSCMISWKVNPPTSNGTGSNSEAQVMVDVKNIETGHVVTYKKLADKQELHIKALKYNSSSHVTVRVVEQFQVDAEDWYLVLAKQTRILHVKERKVGPAEKAKVKSDGVKIIVPGKEDLSQNKKATKGKKKDKANQSSKASGIEKDKVQEENTGFISKLDVPPKHVHVEPGENGKANDFSGQWSVTTKVKKVTDEGFQVCWDVTRNKAKQKISTYSVEVNVIATGSDHVLVQKPTSANAKKLTVRNLAAGELHTVNVLVMEKQPMTDDDTRPLVLAQSSTTVITLPLAACSVSSDEESLCDQDSVDMPPPQLPVLLYNEFKQKMGSKSAEHEETNSAVTTQLNQDEQWMTSLIKHVSESQSQSSLFLHYDNNTHLNTNRLSECTDEEDTFANHMFTHINEVPPYITHDQPQVIEEDYSYLMLSSDDDNDDDDNDDNSSAGDISFSIQDWQNSPLFATLSTQVPPSVMLTLPFDSEEDYSYLQQSDGTSSEDAQSCSSDHTFSQDVCELLGNGEKKQKELATLMLQKKTIVIIEDTDEAQVLQDNSNQFTLTCKVYNVTHIGFNVIWNTTSSKQTKQSKQLKETRVLVEVQDVKSKEVYTYFPQASGSKQLAVQNLQERGCYHVWVKLVKDMILDAKHWTCILAQTPKQSVTLKKQITMKSKPATAKSIPKGAPDSVQHESCIPSLLSLNPLARHTDRPVLQYQAPKPYLTAPATIHQQRNQFLIAPKQSGWMPGQYNSQCQPTPHSDQTGTQSQTNMSLDHYSLGYHDSDIRSASPQPLALQSNVNRILLQQLQLRVEALCQKFSNRGSLLRYYGYSLQMQEKIKPFSPQQLHQLEEKARNLVSKTKNQATASITRLYRNKPADYFFNILKNYNGLMKPYEKDYNGDPCCPINGQIDGLFFSGMVDKKGNLPTRSPFGDTRFIMPIHKLFNQYTNLYFADFYCNNKDRQPHYITLVITVPGSSADRFCSPRLLLLDKYSNPYFCIDYRMGCVRINKTVWIEILYTETVDLLHEMMNGSTWQRGVETIGKGSSSDKGIPKNPKCKVCNL